MRLRIALRFKRNRCYLLRLEILERMGFIMNHPAINLMIIFKHAVQFLQFGDDNITPFITADSHCILIVALQSSV